MCQANIENLGTRLTAPPDGNMSAPGSDGVVVEQSTREATQTHTMTGRTQSEHETMPLCARRTESRQEPRMSLESELDATMYRALAVEQANLITQQQHTLREASEAMGRATLTVRELYQELALVKAYNAEISSAALLCQCGAMRPWQ